MAREYNRRSISGQKSKAPRIFFLALSTFLCGYLTATVFDFTSLSNWIHSNISPKPEVEKQKIAKKPVLPKPKFEFYTLLTKDQNQVPVAKAISKNPNRPKPVEEAAVISTTAVASLKSSAKKENFLVQIASFKSRPEAEHLKATLALKGFEASIVTAPIQEGGWFRVVLGPYSSRGVAEKAQLTVAEREHIKAMVRKVDV